MAIAGFDLNELSIETEHNTLLVRGQKAQKTEGRKFLHQGIAERNFERKFQLSDYIKVTGATAEHGLLHIELVREVPEALKPRKISISEGTRQHNLLEQAAAQPAELGTKAAAIQ
jgi:molecular chaperone IbpA